MDHPVKSTPLPKVSDAADAEIILRGVVPTVDASDRKTRSRNKSKKLKDGTGGAGEESDDADDEGELLRLLEVTWGESQR